MNIKISIILPIYNVEKYLKQCLYTIVGRYEDRIEILLIDDGSLDSSGIIADRFAEQYSNVTVYHKPNGGLSDARNYGLRRAKGQYVFFLDSDDFIMEHSLDILLSAVSDRELDMVLWDADLYDENGEKIDNSTDYCHHVGVKPDCVSTGQTVIEAQIARRNDYVTTVWLGLYNREFLLSNHLWFEKGLLHEDEMWSQKVFIAAERVIYVKEPLYCYRIRENSIMRRADQDYSKNISSLIYIFSSLLAYYDWKIEDVHFRNILAGNTVKRFLHMIGRYEVYKYPELQRRINRKQLFLNANTAKDKLRALVLLFNIRLYCVMMRKAKKSQHTFLK